MKNIILLLLFLLSTLSIFAQKKFTISGYIRDAESREDLISANVIDSKSRNGTVSNTYGFYSMTLPAGKVLLRISYVGYKEFGAEIDLKNDIQLDINLESISNIKEVEVIATKAEKIEERSQMSRIDVPIEQIKKIPALLGEVDVLKALQLLPGVQGGSEGQNGIYVRGGGPDQNLITLDGVPVYNVSHVLGFFSVFNADALKNVTLYKGGFPARYGGRLSSVIDINMKEGNMEKFHGEGSIGMVASRLTLEGPIIKDKTSFIVSGRRTYVDLLMKPFIAAANTGSNEDVGIKLNFYDLNAKINHKINAKNRIFLSAYSGKDIFQTSITEGKKADPDYSRLGFGINWGNLTSALRWNYEINNKLFANTTLTYSNYLFEFGAEIDTKNGNDTLSSTIAKYTSGIKDFAAKIDFDYVPNPHHYIKTGVNWINHTYNPGATQFKLVEGNQKPLLDTLLGSQKTKANEFAIYIEDDMRYGAFKANIGLHASGFDVNNTFYTSLQPRIGLNYLISNSVALKASFCTMRQYINLLTNEGLGLPSDLWVPSTGKVKPQDAWQVAIGTAKTLWDEYEFSLEGYYKQMKNVVSYKPGVSFIGTNQDWQDKITQGEGEAYGAEFLIQKKKGRFNGWLGYTLSWNWRQFNDINSGNRFPFRYDRRHDVEIVANYKITDRWTVSGTWVYGTGNAISLTNQYYLMQNNFVGWWGSDGGFPGNQQILGNDANVNNIAQPSEKNAYRMNPYHRLDVGFEYKRKKKKTERTWSFGAYNAYNRRNPFFIYSGYSDAKKKDVYKQVSIFPIIPNVAWGMKF